MLTTAAAASSSSRHGKGRIEVIWLPILITLLAANFIALLVHMWYFLPDLASDIAGVNSLARDSNTLGKSKDHGGDVMARSSGSAKLSKKRIREKKTDNGSSNALKEALSSKHIKEGAEAIIRYDIVPSILAETRGSYGVVHQLPSIPDRRRMIGGGQQNQRQNQHKQYHVPSNAVHNLTYFLESRVRPNEEDRPLFIYNPMILPLDSRFIDDAIISNLSGGDVHDAAYVAVYRVSNFGNCHGPGRGVPDSYRNYLGLALLDEDLNILREEPLGSGDMDDGNEHRYLDVVIDMNQQLCDADWTPAGVSKCRPPKTNQYMQDCQLFAAPSSSSSTGESSKKADQLILLCNEYAMPVKLERRRGRGKMRGDENLDTLNEGKKGEDGIHLNNKYGSGLQLTVLQRPIMILYGGKNMHYFQASAITDDRGGAASGNATGFLEIWPGGPHEYLPVDFSSYPFVNYKEAKRNIMKASELEPAASFATLDAPADGGGSSNVLIDRDSGSACCVSIRWKQDDSSDEEERHLLLGFSHRKTRKMPKEGKYNYVSRVYAFEPTSPFDIVARSGFFCLGFAPLDDEEAMQSDNEQIWGAANDYRLKIHNEEFDCPRIHFVTGIAEKVGDEETVIVSYGVNDCYPRMMEVSKKFLVSLLRA